MKKRLFTLALVVGVLLSMSVSAWADVYYYRLGSITPPAPSYGTEGNEVTLKFSVQVRVTKFASDQGDTATAEEATFFKSANLLNWTLENFDISDEDAAVTVTFGSTPATNANTTPGSNYYIINAVGDLITEGTTLTDGSVVAKTANVSVKGTVTDNTKPVNVAVSLYSATDADNNLIEVTTENVTTTLENGEPAFSDVTPVDVIITALTEDEYAAANATITYKVYDPYDATPSSDKTPRSPDNYIGLDPAFKNSNGTATKAGGKPKITTKTITSFAAGTKSSTDITITGGAMSQIDVYIAGKDAAKLGYITKDEAKTTNVPLTRANVYKYGIPFRVVSYDIQSGDTKTNKATVKLAFTGASVDLKGYPLTIAATNALTTSKPVAKAVKITVGDGTSIPTWYVPNASTDWYVSNDELYYGERIPAGATPIYGYWMSEYCDYDYLIDALISEEWFNEFWTASQSADLWEEWEEDYSVTKKRTLTETFDIVSTDSDGNIALKSYSDEGSLLDENGSYDIEFLSLGATYTYSDDEGNDAEGDYFYSRYASVISQDGKEYILWAEIASEDYAISHDIVWVSKDLKVFDYYCNTTYYVDSALPEKAKGVDYEISIEDGGKIPERTYKVSTDIGPYVITAKPAIDKVKNGVTYKLYQPEYDGMGNLSKDGYVIISGQFDDKALLKETKTAITLTATNPSTKKKSVLKVTVKGTIPPYFEEKQLDSTKSTASKKYIKTPKAVVAGKVPGAKFKAKGSKTIYYKPATTEDTALLKSLGLSLDDKKGTLSALTKGTTYPTSKDSATADQIEKGITGLYVSDPKELGVIAYNGAGETTIYAELSITGAKPKFSTKNVNFAATDTVKAIELTTPSANDAAASVRFSVAEGSTLPTGVALYNWDEIKVTQTVYKSGDKTVSWDITIDSGDAMPGTYSSDVYFTSGDSTYKLKTGYTVEKNLSADTTVDSHYVASGDVVIQMLSSDKITVLDHVVSSDEEAYRVVSGSIQVLSPDATYKNKGVLMITSRTATEKPVTVGIVADNVGIKVTGKVKISVAAASSARTGKGSEGSDYDAVALLAQTRRNGTAGKTGNGLAGGNGDYAEGSDDAEDAEGEGNLTIGAARTIANLTEAQKAYLAEKGYKVIAVLPELTADESKQYDVDDIELDEEAPEGAEMLYIPFPKDAEPSEDDEIVDFYDDAGAPVEGVPASHKIIASPWLREGVTYEPVIAIEAE